MDRMPRASTRPRSLRRGTAASEFPENVLWLAGARVFRGYDSCIDLHFGMCDTSVYLPSATPPKKLLRSRGERLRMRLLALPAFARRGGHVEIPGASN